MLNLEDYMFVNVFTTKKVWDGHPRFAQNRLPRVHWDETEFSLDPLLQVDVPPFY